MRIIKLLFLINFSLLITTASKCQIIDSTSFKLYTRLSFYSHERNGEFLLHLPAGITGKNLSVSIMSGRGPLASWTGMPTGKILRIPFLINIPASVYDTKAKIIINASQSKIYTTATKLIILQAKSNEVKTDRLTGGLVVNKRQFFPFGFYCYSPVYPTLPEEEAVRGFNMMSPYQKIMPETFSDRKAYMDRCAELGMKVNYNLLSVSGGGGVGSKIESLSDTEKRDRLISEIKAFKDHPALLGWYISDEPNGANVSPGKLDEIYRTVKEIDPWHPVSIVFMAPFLSSAKYINAMDIVMADPYPVPVLPVSLVGNVTNQLKTEFNGKRVLWIVPQAFGGGEIWEREPTFQEIRSMTWQSIINGATGIQYFVRQGLNHFPKSISTWSECGRIAMEVAELTPWLLSDETTLPVQSYSQNVLISSKRYNNQLLIMAVNKLNEPTALTIRISGISSGKARLIFENRSLLINGGLLSDHISPLGSQIYLIDLKPEESPKPTAYPNLLKDPGFEDTSSPGVPSACYARPGGDRGATYFLDTREFIEGTHSLRLITPVKDKSVTIRFFPFTVKAGSSYTISIWAKSDPELRLQNVTNQKNDRLSEKKETPQFVEMLLGEFSRARFVPGDEWKEYVTFVTIPADTLAFFKTNLILKMPGQGVAWFDKVKVSEDK